MATHLFVAHLPFALILVGATIDVLGAATGTDTWRRVGGVLLMAGAFFALTAFFTGQAALGYAMARPQAEFARIEAHTQWGGAGVWLLAIAGGLRAAYRRHTRGLYGWINLALAVGSAALIVAITYSGLLIAHGG